MSNIYIGTSGWSYKHWKGIFYPENISQKNWFSYYCRYFNSVELNATFYRWFKDNTFLNWREKAPEGFKYVLKTPRLITHFRRLKNCDKELRDFYASACLLEHTLGLILLQLPPDFKYNPDLLKSVLDRFNEPHRMVIEFRNQSWIRSETFALLNEHNAAYCIVDSPELKDLPVFQEYVFSDKSDPADPGPSFPVTSDAAYIRMHGRAKWFDYNYSNQELHDLSKIIIFLSNKGIKDIYIFFNNDTAGYAVSNALFFKELLLKNNDLL
jgi:uncharacterized protein YecE (DUF72 family)